MLTLDSFFQQIDNTLNTSKFKDCSYPVFRGHSDDSYKLLPTLQRDYSKTGQVLEKLENNLYCHFRSLVGPRINFKSSWETLFAMRHEGIPTRLLDWTENLGTALFFALDSLTIQKPHIWLLDPYKLNIKAYGKAVLLNPEEDIKPEYHESYAVLCNDNTINIHEFPIAVYPNRTNDRIFAQRGLFTIHGSNNDSIENLIPEAVERITIPDGLIQPIKKLLQNFGINKYSVYPDLKGLCDYLKEYYKY